MTNSNEGFMDALALNNEGASLFDEIRQIDESGNEYWLARDLMSILGYQQWRQFEDAIERAIASCKNIGNDDSQHFLRSTAKSSGGRRGADFRLSRYGAYLTAMNGDSRKPAIAAAQSYFAAKTRIAELGSSPINQESLLANITAAIEKALAPINQKLEQIEQRPSTLPPAKSTKLPWTLPGDTSTEEVPDGYIQIEDGSWLSPDAYELMLGQSRRSLPWELREIRKRPELE